MRSIRSKLLRGHKKCSLCNKKILFAGYNLKGRVAQIMEQKILCYDCAYWEQIIKYPPKFLEVLNGVCLKVLPWVEDINKATILGGQGAKRYFLRTDGSLLSSNDIWTIGKIPDRFREQLPDTITEVEPKAFEKWSKNPRKCFARGCFDRYHCFRFQTELEEGQRPLNKIPESWKPGSERCRYFINKNNFFLNQ